MMAIGEAPLCMRNTFLQLWLEISLFLSEWVQFGHSQYHSPPEVVTPLRVTGTHRWMSNSGWLSYSLYFGGQRHIVHMKAKKFLVSKHFSVFTYTHQGALHEDQTLGQNDCYYDGYVEGDPESLVVLSTCFGGFQGMLEINDTVYEIKPKRLSATFEHLVYKIDSEETHFPPRRCGLTEEELARQLKLQRNNAFILKQSSYESWWTHKMYLETVLVVDHERYLYKKSNVSLVIEEVLVMANEINTFFSAVEVNMVLLGIEVWNEKNPFVVDNIYTVLEYFCKWRKVSLLPRIKHDLAHVLVKYDFGIYLGLAYVGGVCETITECGVDRVLGDTIYKFALTVTHEMGHNMGMYHDEDFCTCGRGTCIMYAEETDATKFSNCSYAEMWENLPNMNCVLNKPEHMGISRKKRCRNGVVDEGEQCDCGSPKLCTNDTCCLETCQLRSGAACASGLCCDDCQIMPSGTVCREKDNECDLPEWCNGTSPECPDDVYVQDGLPCMDGAGYCHEKRCNARDEQCRQIFGKESQSARQSCYSGMNTRGDRFGNCGHSGGNYVKCNTSDILCGRVQCENVKEIPLFRNHTTVHGTQVNGVTCWGTDYHLGMTIPDIGEVKDGTECGIEHVCIRQKCVSMSYWKSDCTSLTCNMKGICNNKHHCHCDSYWEPPNCMKKGNGGSVDSGPPPLRPMYKADSPPVTPEKETSPTPARPVSETSPTPARPVSETGPTPGRPVSETGPTPARPVNENGPSPAKPVNENVPEKNFVATYFLFLFFLLLFILLLVLLLCGKHEKPYKKEQPSGGRASETAHPVPGTAPEMAKPGPKTAPEMAQPGPETAPEMAQPGPETAPELAKPGPETAPEIAQPGPEIAPEMAQPGPETAPELAKPGTETAPEIAQPGPETAPEMAQLGPETAPLMEQSDV